MSKVASENLIDADLANPWKLASTGELDDLKKLIDKGIPIDDKDERGFTPITWASRSNVTR